MCDLLKEVVFSNGQSGFGCTLELAFFNCSVFKPYSALFNLREKHSPPVTFPHEISTECFDTASCHI